MLIWHKNDSILITSKEYSVILTTYFYILWHESEDVNKKAYFPKVIWF